MTEDKPFYFVEIGCNTFDTLIPLAEAGWQGLCVEPVRCYFDDIPRVQGVAYDNVAIDSTRGYKVIHRLPENIAEQVKDKTGFNAHGWGCFSNDQASIVKYDLQRHLIQEEVECITLDDLVDRHGITHIDYLVIDTEGNDKRILESLDFAKLFPTIIRFEHSHLSDEDMLFCVWKLLNSGYHLHRMRNDIVARSTAFHGGEESLRRAERVVASIRNPKEITKG